MQQALSDVSRMLRSQNESRSQSESLRSASQQVVPRAQQPLLQVQSHRGSGCVEPYEGPLTSHVVDYSFLVLNSVDLNLQEGASILNQAEQVLLLNSLPDDSVVQQFNHVNWLIEGDHQIV